MSLGREVGHGLGHIVLHGESASKSPSGAQSPNSRSMFIVSTRSPISATAEHLLWIKMPLVRRQASAQATLC